MKIRRWTRAALLVVALSVGVFTMALAEERKRSAVAAQEVGAKGWTALFNGKDLDGWKFHLGKGDDNKGTFTVKDGVLICTGKPNGYMYTEKPYSTYTLECEFAFKRPEGLTNDSKFPGNSGVLIHVGQKNAMGVWPRSIEVQGMNRDLGIILPIPRSVKCKRTFDKETMLKVRQPVGEYNRIEIAVNRGDMVIKLNGTVVSTVGDCELSEGAIGIQSEGAETHWKSIRIWEK
jgi:hypothetical protein